ncbi:MAG: HlyD family efflux transporter periplasmic adaptor subunit, partial [Steroidobacteraceae bacterium]|nr:HlyD family efflux transporter periplasmic adaptor subunit [Steroidobacteraceae bacterium]
MPKSVPSVPSPRRARVAGVASLLALAAAAPVPAHEGHDHEAAAAAPAMVAAAPGTPARDVVELRSELYEALVESHGDHLDIWLDRFDTNEPVTGAKLGVALGDAAEVAAKEETPGQYMAPITPLAPGSAASLTLSIQAGPGDDLLGGTLEIAARDAPDLGSRLGGWLAAGWRWALGLLLLGLAAVLLLRRRGQSRAGGVVAGLALLAPAGLAAWALLQPLAALAHEGHDHAEEEGTPAPVVAGGDRPMRLADGSVFVPKPTQRILELRTQLAAEGPTPVSLRLVGEIVGDPRASAVLQTTAAEAARVAAELVQAEAELVRLEGLPGVVARAEVDAARARVASLRAQRAALGAPLAAGGESLASPIDGVVAAVDARPGAVAAPGEPLVTVIDPARLSIEALAFESFAP